MLDVNVSKQLLLSFCPEQEVVPIMVVSEGGHTRCCVDAAELCGQGSRVALLSLHWC